jgi:hypothetical protein
MTHTKRQCDPLGRSTAPYRYRLHALCLVIAITGSAWPIHARSIRAAFDTQKRSKAWRLRSPSARHAPC